MSKKRYPKVERRKKNLVNRNRRLAREMKTITGLMEYFQTQLPKKVVNRR